MGEVPQGSEWADFEAAYFAEVGSQVTREMMVGFLKGGARSRAAFVARPEVVQAWGGRVLILTSRDDALSFTSLEALQAYYPQTVAHVFDRGGHHTLFFFPEEYVQVLDGYLRSLIAGGPADEAISR
jgi:pimeloyl-ACP methyl ester carboxylesterase